MEPGVRVSSREGSGCHRGNSVTTGVCAFAAAADSRNCVLPARGKHTGAVAGRGSDPGLVLTPRVGRSSLYRPVDEIFRAVRFVNRKIRVSLQATQVRNFDGQTVSDCVPPTATTSQGRTSVSG
ncbi:hypothetical protein D9M72_197810 [compost metagenome]